MSRGSAPWTPPTERSTTCPNESGPSQEESLGGQDGWHRPAPGKRRGGLARAGLLARCEVFRRYGLLGQHAAGRRIVRARDPLQEYLEGSSNRFTVDRADQSFIEGRGWSDHSLRANHFAPGQDRAGKRAADSESIRRPRRPGRLPTNGAPAHSSSIKCWRSTAMRCCT